MPCDRGSFPPLPRYLFDGDYVELHEDQVNEFKHTSDSVGNLSLKYIPAFLNSSGGRLWMGISDDGFVHGIKKMDTTREEFEYEVKHILKKVFPPIPSDLVKLHFIPVISRKEKSVQVQNEEEIYQLESLYYHNWVVVLEVKKGPLGIYKIKNFSQRPFHRYGAEAPSIACDVITRRKDDILMSYMKKSISERNKKEFEHTEKIESGKNIDAWNSE